jgi:FtsH-binding integral membrane protein
MNAVIDLKALAISVGGAIVVGLLIYLNLWGIRRRRTMTKEEIRAEAEDLSHLDNG